MNKYIKALQDIKKHCEAISSQSFFGEPLYKKNAVWQIANRALEDYNSSNGGMADASDLKSDDRLGRVGSSPTSSIYEN